MTIAETPGGGGSSSGRLRTLLMSLVVIGAVGFAVHRFTSQAGESRVRAKTRTAADYVVPWKCEACGYGEQQAAQAGTRPCPKCAGGRMSVVFSWRCARHGAVPIRYEYDDAGEPLRVRIGAGEWTSYAEATAADEGIFLPVCPQCGQDLVPPM